jgi:DnaK suppressor protein
MATKKAAAKRKSTTASKKRLARGKTSRSASGRSRGSARKMPGRTSAKRTVKSAKPPSHKKAPSKKASAQKSSPKSAGQTKAKTVAKKPISARHAFNASGIHAIERSGAAAKRRLSGNLLTGPLRGFTPYQPRRGETYMSKGQLEHFKQILLAWKRELMEEVDRTMLHMKDDAANFPDPNDRATQESEFGLELRTRDRERKLLKKIDSALARIDDGSYGYCEETGDEIGLRRLEARPVATLCVEAQERRELAERQFRDREDQYR